MTQRGVTSIAVVIGIGLSLLSGCGYNDLQGLDEDTKAAWSEVINQYQRRADLIPNLVNTVKGYAAHEKDTLEGVVEARAKATSIQVRRKHCATRLPLSSFKKPRRGCRRRLDG